jgi:hypothetical protein
MRKALVSLAAVCLLSGAVFAGGVDGVSTSPLRIWGTGFGGGGFFPLSDSGKTLGKVIWMNSFDFTENVALFADINWYLSDTSLVNLGIELGLDYVFLADTRVSPFLGAGGEAGYFDKGLGMAGGGFVRAGVALKLTNTVDVKVRVPFHVMVGGDSKKDFGVGIEVGAMFYSRLRGVRQLNY